MQNALRAPDTKLIWSFCTSISWCTYAIATSIWHTLIDIRLHYHPLKFHRDLQRATTVLLMCVARDNCQFAKLLQIDFLMDNVSVSLHWCTWISWYTAHYYIFILYTQMDIRLHYHPLKFHRDLLMCVARDNCSLQRATSGTTVLLNDLFNGQCIGVLHCCTWISWYTDTITYSYCTHKWTFVCTITLKFHRDLLMCV